MARGSYKISVARGSFQARRARTLRNALRNAILHMNSLHSAMFCSIGIRRWREEVVLAQQERTNEERTNEEKAAQIPQLESPIARLKKKNKELAGEKTQDWNEMNAKVKELAKPPYLYFEAEQSHSY